MSSLAVTTDERVRNVEVTEDTLTVALMDGRCISVPLVWYPRLLHADDAQRRNWQVAGGGYGIHWPDIDEDLSVEGLQKRGTGPAPEGSKQTELGVASRSGEWRRC